MFKLRKIITSGVNVPEPEYLETMGGYDVAPGSALVSHDGVLTVGAQDEKPTHISLQYLKEDDCRVICYRILPTMLFEVEVIGSNITNIFKGDKLGLYCSPYGMTALTDTTEGGVATVYDCNNAKKSGDTMYVTFD